MEKSSTPADVIRKVLAGDVPLRENARYRIIAVAHPGGIDKDDMTRERYFNELDKEQVKRVAPFFVGKKLAKSHGVPNATEGKFDEEPLAIGTIKKVEIDTNGRMVMAADTEPTAEAIFEITRILTGDKTDVSIGLIRLLNTETDTLTWKPDHLALTGKGFYDGTRVVAVIPYDKTADKARILHYDDAPLDQILYNLVTQSSIELGQEEFIREVNESLPEGSLIERCEIPEPKEVEKPSEEEEEKMDTTEVIANGHESEREQTGTMQIEEKKTEDGEREREGEMVVVEEEKGEEAKVEEKASDETPLDPSPEPPLPVLPSTDKPPPQHPTELVGEQATKTAAVAEIIHTQPSTINNAPSASSISSPLGVSRSVVGYSQQTAFSILPPRLAVGPARTTSLFTRPSFKPSFKIPIPPKPLTQPVSFSASEAKANTMSSSTAPATTTTTTSTSAAVPTVTEAAPAADGIETALPPPPEIAPFTDAELATLNPDPTTYDATQLARLIQTLAEQREKSMKLEQEKTQYQQELGQYHERDNHTSQDFLSKFLGYVSDDAREAYGLDSDTIQKGMEQLAQLKQAPELQRMITGVAAYSSDVQEHLGMTPDNSQRRERELQLKSAAARLLSTIPTPSAAANPIVRPCSAGKAPAPALAPTAIKQFSRFHNRLPQTTTTSTSSSSQSSGNFYNIGQLGTNFSMDDGRQAPSSLVVELDRSLFE